jgi:hypothetical protein
MKRDQFTPSVQQADSGPPTLDITYDGPADELDNRLSENGEPIPATDLDAAFRRRESADGVFSLTHRVTGAYLLEANADTAAVRTLVAAAREADDDASYRIRIHGTDSDVTVYQMSALLVYDSDGKLLRQRSLIPSGVEL